MLVVRMVRVTGIEEVELGVVDFILSDSALEVWSISSDKSGSFVDDISASQGE